MNEPLISNAEIAFYKGKKIYFCLEKKLPDAELKKLVSRAAKNAAVPEDLESRTLDFIKRAIVE